MPKKTVKFDDGSSIIWKDRESLRYEDAFHVALIWLDFEPGFFKRGRVLRLESLARWHAYPAGSREAIQPEERAEIVKKVRSYMRGVPIRVE